MPDPIGDLARKWHGDVSVLPDDLAVKPAGIHGLVQSKRAGERATTNERVRPLELQKQSVDEQLLDVDRAMNQLKQWIVAQGPQPRASARQSRATAPADEIMATLGKMADLHDRGALTDEEYQTKKAELLSRL